MARAYYLLTIATSGKIPHYELKWKLVSISRKHQNILEELDNNERSGKRANQISERVNRQRKWHRFRAKINGHIRGLDKLSSTQ